MNNHEIVKKLIGPIEPVGETNEDGRRFENLEAMTELFNNLLADIAEVARFNKDRVEYSMNKAGKHAQSSLAVHGIEDY